MEKPLIELRSSTSTTKMPEKEQKLRSFMKKYRNGIKVLINDGGWDRNHMDDVVTEIAVWKVRGLWLDRNEEPKIISKIADIRFEALQSLVLFENYIQSVEGLCRVCLPSLVGLSLIGNYLSKVSCLRRLCSPNLIVLQLGRNKVVEMDWITETNANLTTLRIEYPSDVNHCTEMRWLAKVESSQLDLLNIDGMFGIRQRKVETVINRKFYDLFHQA